MITDNQILERITSNYYKKEQIYFWRQVEEGQITDEKLILDEWNKIDSDHELYDWKCGIILKK